jgi:hypothetical protein
LSLRSIEFHYEQSQPFAALGRKACDQATLRRAGFVAVGLPGYYEADLSRLKSGMPNVPVIGLRIGQVTFPAQVDTGYGDLPEGVVQVNAALMRTLRETGMPVHSLPSDIVTVGCSGTYTYERWQIEHEELSIVTPGGHIVASYPPPLLEVKTDAHCSGISTFAEPFAQIGASPVVAVGAERVRRFELRCLDSHRPVALMHGSKLDIPSSALPDGGGASLPSFCRFLSARGLHERGCRRAPSSS